MGGGYQVIVLKVFPCLKCSLLNRSIEPFCLLCYATFYCSIKLAFPANVFFLFVKFGGGGKLNQINYVVYTVILGVNVVVLGNFVASPYYYPHLFVKSKERGLPVYYMFGR